jgi:hypothetical protein
MISDPELADGDWAPVSNAQAGIGITKKVMTKKLRIN